MLDKTLHVSMEDVRAAPQLHEDAGRGGESFIGGRGARARNPRR
jgi:hypothetical protein